MKAKITKREHDGKIRQNRKEDKLLYEYAAIMPALSDMRENPPSARAIVTLRVYGTGAMNYACLWARDAGGAISISGGGRAGGYGYHRASAAVQAAFDDAGIQLSEDIGGRGDRAIEEAVYALARALTKKKTLIHKAHG